MTRQKCINNDHKCRLKKTQKFKCLNEILIPNINEKAAIDERGIIKSECLYAADIIVWKRLLAIVKEGRKLYKVNIGPKKVTVNEFSCHLRSNQLYEKFKKI